MSVQPQITGLAFNPGIVRTEPTPSRDPAVAGPRGAPGIPGPRPGLSFPRQDPTLSSTPPLGPGHGALGRQEHPQAVPPPVPWPRRGPPGATSCPSGPCPTGSGAASSPQVTPGSPPPQVPPIQPAPAGVGTSPAPVAKVSPSPVPITCSETPTVSQLVSNPPAPPSAEEDGINLEEIREFAKNFKLRRLSLGLTQTQVGQALTATEGPAYSQSAICRFEKLDITPKTIGTLATGFVPLAMDFVPLPPCLCPPVPVCVPPVPSSSRLSRL
ncbi:PREDICTED: POU domain, class 6, transcription factor 1 [Corvus brachyrhynchos]|uniref:POU domain, class 6, transcription factor 1 n=1 Tax=Corvus brachyrhynchos TaxID=85066 RepID=UPI0008165B23|nr:PREDICTED: POU domain, class 6, transcription factor 1 [Corvus brachyrhynchos]